MVFGKVLLMLSSMPIFSFIWYTLTLSYLENLTINDKFINKQVLLYFIARFNCLITCIKVAGLQPTSFLKKNSNTDAFL